MVLTTDFVTSLDVQNCKKVGMDHFLLEFFWYHDVLARATDPLRQPLDSKWDDIFASLTSSSSAGHHTESHMIGAYNGLLGMVAKLSAFQQKIYDAQGQVNGLLISEAMDLWTELDQWQRSSSSDAAHDDDPKQERFVCSAYICALFVWLFALIYPTNISDDKVQQVVREGLRNLGQITNVRSTAVLLFPVFVFGFAAVEDDTRDEISAQFRKIIAFSGFGNARLARDVVRQWWTDYDSGKCTSLSWTQRMEHYDTSVILT